MSAELMGAFSDGTLVAAMQGAAVSGAAGIG